MDILLQNTTRTTKFNFTNFASHEKLQSIKISHYKVIPPMPGSHAVQTYIGYIKAVEIQVLTPQGSAQVGQCMHACMRVCVCARARVCVCVCVCHAQVCMYMGSAQMNLGNCPLI